MAYAPFIVTRIERIDGFFSSRYTLTTHPPQHLWLSAMAEYPALRPRFVRRYGHTRQCGFYLAWRPILSIEQEQQGPSSLNTFFAPPLWVRGTLWLVAATAPQPAPGVASTIPFPSGPPD